MKNPFANFWSKLHPEKPGSKEKTVHDQIEDQSNLADEITVPCCSENVHIAYRGVSDDRLYLSNDRKWQEVKFFKPHGLRVFCAECRRRIY